MTIGEIAKVSGLSASAIRYYESAGVLPRAARKSGVRQYDESSVDVLKLLRYYRLCGVPVDRLVDLFHPDPSLREERRKLIRLRIAELDNNIQEAERMKQRLHALLDCACEGERSRCVIYGEGDA
jgi:DNA-binding transcriptional MerR regulator